MANDLHLLVPTSTAAELGQHLDNKSDLGNPSGAPDTGSQAVDIDPRIDMDQRLWLPRCFLDWLTGKPILDGRSHKVKLDPAAYLALDIGIIAGTTVTLAITASTAPLWFTLLAAKVLWPIQVGRLRKQQTLEGHEAAHGNFFLAGDSRRESSCNFLGLTLNDWAGEISTTAALSTNVEKYRADHDLHHAAATYTTKADPDTETVLGLRNYIVSLLNPLAYARDFARRLHSNLIAARPVRRVMGAAMVTLLGGSAFFMPFSAWLVAVGIPWVVLFRLAGALQIMSLHDWLLPPAGTDGTTASHQRYADRTWARFSGVPLPKRDLKGFSWLKAWTAWWAEMIIVELPFRVGVLSPDLQNHDVHHLEWVLAKEMGVLPDFVDDWRNQPFRRAEVIRDSGDPLGMAKREYWGVRSFIKLARRNLDRLNGRLSTPD